MKTIMIILGILLFIAIAFCVWALCKSAKKADKEADRQQREKRHGYLTVDEQIVMLRDLLDEAENNPEYFDPKWVQLYRQTLEMLEGLQK